MMANKTIKALIIVITISFSIIVSVPILILSTALSSYGRISKSLFYYYNPSEPTFIKELNINADIGEIEIRYITESSEYYAKVEVKIEMLGEGLASKSYLNYFKIEWQNESDYINFTMEIKGDMDLIEVLSLIKNIRILIFLRANVNCDIGIKVNIKGNTYLTVPFGSSVGNIKANISNGDIQYDLSYCTIEGNITGIIQEEGDLKLKFYNVEYNQNNTWCFNTRIGNIFLDIVQYTDINGNISGTITHEQGYISFTYQDDRINNGAYFTVYYHEDDLTLSNEIDESVGFNLHHSDEQPIVYLWCYDYPSKNNYNLLINNSNGLTHKFDLDA